MEPLSPQQIEEMLQQGENSSIEFKNSEARPESIARELVAFANTLGGTLFLGVEDDRTITGIDRDNLEEWVTNIARNNITPAIAPNIAIHQIDQVQIAIITISKGIHKPYQTLDGKYWIRVGSTNRSATKEELSRLFQQAGLVHYDLSPIEGMTITDLDPPLLQTYWQGYYDINYASLRLEEQINLLQNADILIPWEEHTVCSLGGLLIFGKSPQRRIPQSAITLAVFKGLEITDELIDKKEIVGTLASLIDNTATLMKLFIPKPSKIVDMKREEADLIPGTVMREALVNAVCHRDYSLVNQKNTVYLFSNRIEITSPGKIGNTLTLEKIKTGNSAPRNHLIFKFLDNMRYIDGLGRGIPTIIKLMGKRVLLEEIGELFRITLLFK